MKRAAANQPPSSFRMPAEWEPHAATWLAWPHCKDDWPGKFEPIPAAKRVSTLARNRHSAGRPPQYRFGQDLC